MHKLRTWLRTLCNSAGAEPERNLHDGILDVLLGGLHRDGAVHRDEQRSFTWRGICGVYAWISWELDI